MARSKRRFPTLSPELKNELAGILFLGLSLLLFLSLFSYHLDDLTFFTSHPSTQVQNLCGVFGAAVAGVVRSAIGLTGFLLPLIGFIWAFTRFQGKRPQKLVIKLSSILVFCLTTSSLLSIILSQDQDARVFRGGVVGLLVGTQMLHYFGWWGAFVILSMLSLLSFVLVTELAVWPVVSRMGEWAAIPLRVMGESWRSSRVSLPKVLAPKTTVVHRSREKKEVQEGKQEKPPLPAVKPAIRIFEPASSPKADSSISVSVPQEPKVSAEVRKPPKPKTPLPEELPLGEKPNYRMPALDLLNPPVQSRGPVQGKEWLEKNAKILEEALQDFGIDAKVAEVEMGPVITRYEVEPAPGVKVQKITTLSDDLALVMKAPSVRIIAPIPGKARVGIEVPNLTTAQVNLREILESSAFRQTDSKLTIAIGKDVAGHPLIADLSEMPHLLIAGTTGSGKTVCMNALITSILFNATPEEVRFLMVDPKMVELAAFNGLPHLIMPVITNAKKVSAALQWMVDEMETRYRLFAKLGVRNIDTYHEKQLAGQLPAEEIPDSLPHLVIIIDELADLMLVAQAEIEKTIARLAHLSRAVGIHMVLATQRPSVDVLTGVIKANFPARISFQVATRVDSRTVLDTMGAEKLLGKGDLLFLQPGSSKLVRGQGTLVTDPEIERVTGFWKAQGSPLHDAFFLDEAQAKSEGLGERVKDTLYDDALRVVVEAGQASVSLLQRRMRLGYGRAARILDMMEEEGIVGPIRGAKPREVYLKEIPNESVNRGTSEVRS